MNEKTQAILIIYQMILVGLLAYSLIITMFIHELYLYFTVGNSLFVVLFSYTLLLISGTYGIYAISMIMEKLLDYYNHFKEE